MPEKLIRFDNTSRFLWIDTETQSLCLNGAVNLPWEIGMLETSGEQVISEDSVLIDWGEDFVVSKGAQRQTGYSRQAIIEGGIEPEAALEKLANKMKEADYIGFYNGLGFDVYVINSFFKKLGRDVVEWHKFKGLIDVFAVLKGVEMDVPYQPEQDFLFYQYRALHEKVKGLSLTLTKAAKKYDIEVDEEKTHGGLYDIYLTFFIWNKLKHQIEY